MFIRPKKPQQELHVRHTLDELGYEFDVESGALVSKSTGEKYTYDQPSADKMRCKETYESLIHSASREVYKIITGDDLRMQPIAVPDVTQPHCNIYATPGALSKKHLVVLITGHGNFGAVWGWNILVKCGLKAGSVIEYIRNCVERGFGVLLLNPNENIVAPDGCAETFNSYIGRSIPISGSETPNEHVGHVWRTIIRDCDAQSVAFVSHSSAGTTVVDLLRYDFARFTNKVACAAFIDSTHSTFMLKSGTVSWLRQAAKQWETTSASQLADAEVSDRVGCSVAQVANDSDFRELTPSLCMDELLDYMDSRFKHGPVSGIPEMQPNESLYGNATADPDAFDSSSSDSDLNDNLNGLDDVQFVQNTYNPKAANEDGYVGWD
ncbi:hypothetical protein LPJ59_004403 [Coemansia sp. RSA 2399]|nr:hypothetical protein LPJ59_004403 [Coemansia sp. RSA 2399]KAJ1899401.1 hypothetical protein LPJ81_004150 [Coemansia sp. IMI 209127]